MNPEVTLLSNNMKGQNLSLARGAWICHVASHISQNWLNGFSFLKSNMKVFMTVTCQRSVPCKINKYNVFILSYKIIISCKPILIAFIFLSFRK